MISSFQECILLLLSIISTILPLFVIFLVVTQSPSSMKEYKKFLINFTIHDMLFAISYGFLFGPQSIFPVSGAAISGLLQYFGDTGARLSFAVIIFTGSNMMLAQCFCLGYRWSVMLDNKCFNRFLLSVLCWSLFYGIKTPANLFVGYLFTLLAVPQDQIWKKLEHYNQTFPESPYPLLYVDPFDINTILLFSFVVLALTIMELVQLMFVILILRGLESKKAALTEKSYRLQKQLTFALAAQLVVPIVLVFLPVSFGVMCRYVGTDPTKLAGDIAYFLFATYGACNALLTIVFVKPYYTYVLMKLQRVFYCFKFPQKKHSIIVQSINSNVTGTTLNG